MRIKIINLVILIALAGVTVHADSYYTEPLSKEKMTILPVPRDYRNYFFFQSIDNSSYLIIGDFTGSEKVICMITDENTNNQVTRVVEYSPDSKKMRYPKKPSTGFFKDVESMKRDIIDGRIFRDNYSYKMKCMETLKYKLQDGSDIYKAGDGYAVKFFDPDEPTTLMSEFFFAKKGDRYDLIMQTNYYKVFKSKIQPPVPYAVYCRNSRDPIVKETVEALLKMVPMK